MLEEFKKYVDSFYIGNKESDYGINLKYNHSLRVQKIMEEMALSLNFSKEKFEIASTVGLLHDYGRFYQWKNYHTFHDENSVDHALYGVKLLFDEGDIARYYPNSENYDLIKKAIFNHNKYESSNDEYSKMIRDADKLDIMYLFSIKKSYIEKDISEKVLEDFENERLVNNEHVKSETDVILKILAYVYDFNYDFSFKYLKEHKMIQNIYEKLNNKEKFKDYFDKAIKYIDNKLEVI